ncbi:hypothetical protein ACFY2R_17100 [Micromonospora olivasterospora]|nr:hypothetical protein [Micromonospora olivasterospora]
MDEPASSSPARGAAAPSPADRVTAAALRFYAGGPYVDIGMPCAVLGREVWRLRAREVGEMLASLFGQRYRRVDEGEDRALVVKLRTDDASACDHTPRAALCAGIAAVLLRLPDPPPGSRSALSRAVIDVRAIAAHGGGDAWTREVATYLARGLPPLADLDPAPRVIRSGTSPVPVSDEERAERRRAALANHRDRLAAAARPALVEVVEWVDEWRSSVPPAAYPIADVHAAYRAAKPSSPVGRTTFHRHASAVLRRRRRASGPVYLVAAQEAGRMNATQRRELASLIVDKLAAEWSELALDGLADLVAEHLDARTTTAPPAPTRTAGGNVVDFTRRRRVA